MKWVEVKPPWSRPHCRSCQKKVAINRWTTMNLSRLHGAKESFKEYVVTSFYKINYMYPQSWSPKSTWQCLRCDMEVPILLCHFRYWTGSLDVTAWRHRASESTFYVTIDKKHKKDISWTELNFNTSSWFNYGYSLLVVSVLVAAFTDNQELFFRFDCF